MEKDDDRELGRPEQAIKEVKRNRKQERERLCEECNKLKDKIHNNPKVIEAIRKLERRIELIEEKVY